MKIKAAKAVDSIVKISVELDQTTQDKYEAQGAKLLSKQVSVKGFRKGHVPKKMLIEKFGEDVFIDFVIEKFINQIYAKALQETKVMPVAMPDFELVEKNPIKVEFKVPVAPEVDLSKAKKIKLKLKASKVTKKEVKEEQKKPDPKKPDSPKSQASKQPQKKNDKPYIPPLPIASKNPE